MFFHFGFSILLIKFRCRHFVFNIIVNKKNVKINQKQSGIVYAVNSKIL